MLIMQGDGYALGITIKNNAGSLVTPEDVVDVAVKIGELRKTYQRGEVTWSETKGKWLFPLTQAETLSLRARSQKAQVSVRWNNGVVERKNLLGVRIGESIDKEEL